MRTPGQLWSVLGACRLYSADLLTEDHPMLRKAAAFVIRHHCTFILAVIVLAEPPCGLPC